MPDIKKIFYIVSRILPVFVFVAITSFKPALDCGCNHLGEAEHKRQGIKNRAVSTAEGTPLPIEKMLEMKITADEKKAIKSNPDQALDREKQIVSVTGYAWIIKTSAEDCDIHIEMSETNDSTAKRIIAEIPNTTEYCDFHTRVMEELVRKFHLHKKNEYHFDKGDNNGKPIKMTVTGYLFWDSGHPTNSHHGSAKVGSIWELHPVFKLDWK